MLIDFSHIFHEPFLQFSFVFFAVFLVASLMRLFRQPLIVGFIITGILVSPSLLPVSEGLTQTMEVSSELGVVLLLFLAGLHLNPYFLKTEGKSILLLGLGQILLTGGLAYGMFQFWDFDTLTSVYLAIALTLSSTIITLKFLSDNKQLSHLHGRLGIGILLVQDIFVALAFIVVTALGQEHNGITHLLFSQLGLLLAVLVPAYLTQKYLLPRLLPLIARSQEYFFVFVLAWLLLFSTIFDLAGFSSEVGALLAGIMLAPTLFATEINAKIKPLRDFFLILFFIFLGQQIGLENLAAKWDLVLAGTFFIVVVKPVIVVFLLGLLGYKSSTSLKTAVSLAHISEFSLILVTLGIENGDLEPRFLGFVTLITLISIMISTYLIKYEKHLYKVLKPLLKLSEIGLLQPKKQEQHVYTPQIILIGAKRTGTAIINSLQQAKDDFMVIDFNPELIRSLHAKNIPALYGDLYNLLHLDDIDYSRARFIISTVSDVEANSAALQFLSKDHPNIAYLCYANDETDALQLYERGAAYVLVPHHVGGKFVATLIEDIQRQPDTFVQQKLAHLKLIDS